ncbi:MAG: beta-ketoacyl-[acyl-carrier-protein] synthase family protein [Candidatus Dormibacteria bacterium]
MSQPTERALRARPAPRRVVVTGMGCLTPVGRDLDSTWRALLDGDAGTRTLTRFDASGSPVRTAGEVEGDPTSDSPDARRFAHMDRDSQLAVAAAEQALRHAGIALPLTDPDRVGVVVGTAIGGISTILRMHDAMREQGPRWVSAYFLPNIIPDAPGGHVAITLGARGYNLCPVGACATGGQAVGEGARAVRDGLADVVIAGGAEAPLHPLVLAGFVQMRALAGGDDPAKALRPFDRDRSGFVMSEGAAMLVLEAEEHAIARGAHILAEVLGYAANADAHDMAAPHPDALGLRNAAKMALDDAGVGADEVDYVNTHGTGTPVGDRIEAVAIHRLFASTTPLVSGIKGSVGHMMAAAGALEAITCVKALKEQVVPPTRNHDNPDPELELEVVAGAPRPARLRIAMSNSMGLGGHNACVVFGARS